MSKSLLLIVFLGFSFFFSSFAQSDSLKRKYQLQEMEDKQEKQREARRKDRFNLVIDSINKELKDLFGEGDVYQLLNESGGGIYFIIRNGYVFTIEKAFFDKKFNWRHYWFSCFDGKYPYTPYDFTPEKIFDRLSKKGVGYIYLPISQQTKIDSDGYVRFAVEYFDPKSKGVFIGAQKDFSDAWVRKEVYNFEINLKSRDCYYENAGEGGIFGLGRIGKCSLLKNSYNDSFKKEILGFGYDTLVRESCDFDYPPTRKPVVIKHPK